MLTLTIKVNLDLKIKYIPFLGQRAADITKSLTGKDITTQQMEQKSTKNIFWNKKESRRMLKANLLKTVPELKTSNKNPLNKFSMI